MTHRQHPLHETCGVPGCEICNARDRAFAEDQFRPMELLEESAQSEVEHVARDWYRFDLESASDFIEDGEVRWWVLGWVDGGVGKVRRAAPEGECGEPPPVGVVVAYEAGMKARKAEKSPEPDGQGDDG